MNILITGAGKGIGLELVKLFAQESGNNIIAVSRNTAAIHHWLGHERGNTLPFAGIFPFTFDLLAGDLQQLEEFTALHTNRLDVVINNAGFLLNKPWYDISREDFDRVFHTNVRAVLETTQALFPLLGEGSHILNISSMGGVQGSVKFPGLSVYSASKAAVAVLTECLALEMKESGIAVNALALGAVQTEMLSEAFPGYQAPLTAAQMASFIAQFARTGHRFFNGKVIPVALSTP
ncbi:MAG TPA: SDR family oxidoreductase [Bacteroidales bacterium]|nr:SDR family oxidoreductase [Bacteroidales bacterium]HSA42444.1 SDR family oxidoreductase [Bacteroidales bacterium]